ncbi:hypothetical protein SAMN04489740_3277 [Arthrobacter alpinus]|uniref:Uncharacterized protein n=1 Tax=Arthrobacter alpinus TaxID=656366 RepID=A0A1H5MZZ8_9MICC|nr:hypothetical protein [Arthrobacter alpinus]SEE94959.1 hypothetical protein SAMN04489740_3277 [Arthrobacter alpinus]
MNVSSSPRTDITFLRRRIKAASAQASAPTAGAAISQGANAPLLAPAVPVAPAAPSLTLRSTPQAAAHAAPPAQATPPQRSAGLVLGGGAPASSMGPRAKKLVAQREKARHEDHEVALLFPAPAIEDVYELNLVDRALRLSPLQSSVGTLLVSGSTAVVWESVRRVVGAQTADGHKAGSPVETSGNRELVGYVGSDALITLRHVRELRRAIFINRSSSAMGVRLFSGDTVALPPAAEGTQMVLLVHRIGNVLELRAEPVPLDWQDVAIWQEFDFSMTHRAPSSAYGR